MHVRRTILCLATIFNITPTELAVRAVRQARTDISASEALTAVELVRRLGPDSRD